MNIKNYSYLAHHLELCSLLSWTGNNCFKKSESLQGNSLLLNIKFPEILGSHLIHLKMMKCCAEREFDQRNRVSIPAPYHAIKRDRY